MKQMRSIFIVEYCGYSRICEGLLFTVVRFPNRIARHAQIQILHIIVVVPHINDFRSLLLFHVRLARGIGAVHIVNSRQSGVHFGVSVDNVVESLFAFFQLRAQNHHTLFANFFIDVVAITTIIHQFVGLLTTDARVQFIVAIYAKSHCWNKY